MTVLAAVLRRTLADQRRGLLLWGFSLGAMGAFMAAIYPSIEDVLADLVKSYPKGLVQAFGVGDLSTVEGYVHAEMFSLVVPLAIGYFAVRAMAGPISGGEERGYLDTLLTLPLPRHVLMAATFLSACFAAAGVLLVTGLLTFLSGRIAGTGIALDRTLAAVAGAWSLSVFGAGVAAAACGALHHGRAVIGIGMGTLVAMYAIDVAGRLSDSVEPLRDISAFRYYGAPLRDGLQTGGFLLLIGCGAALAAAGMYLFARRDVLR
jgi:ABC-2 type transport system permease protein